MKLGFQSNNYSKNCPLVAHKLKNFSVNCKEKSIYFDLKDMESPVGSWDVYGQDDKKRYPAMQEEFFERAGKALNRRQAMFAFCSMASLTSLFFWDVRGSKDVKLPITVGPQKPAVLGPRDRI